MCSNVAILRFSGQSTILLVSEIIATTHCPISETFIKGPIEWLVANRTVILGLEKKYQLKVRAKEGLEQRHLDLMTEFPSPCLLN